MIRLPEASSESAVTCGPMPQEGKVSPPGRVASLAGAVPSAFIVQSSKSVSRLLANTILLPLGDQAAVMSSAECCVRFVAVPPAAGIERISAWELTVASYKMNCPSGDQAGSPSKLELSVSGVTVDVESVIT